MLFESVQAMDGLPFSVSFSNVAQESKHCHTGIEIAMVLRGTTNYQIYHMDYELNAGDLIIADIEDLHQIHDSSPDFLVLLIHMDTDYFEKLYPNIRYMFFVCEECMSGPSGSNQILESKLTVLKHAVAKLAFDCERKEKDIALLTEEINHLVSILVNHFQGFFMEDYQYKTSQENISVVDLERLSRITRYIMLNYNQKITLEDVSNMEHLSSYYVSHLVKKTLGFNFQSFVNAIRLEFAEKLLVFTNRPLMQVSEECGFSSPNYFNKCFSAWYGKTPFQYKKEYKTCQRSFHGELNKEEVIALLTPHLNFSELGAGSGGSAATHKVNIFPCFDSRLDSDGKINGPLLEIGRSEEILKLGFFVDRIKKIKPKGFLLSWELLRKVKSSEDLSSMLSALKMFNLPLKADLRETTSLDKRICETLEKFDVSGLDNNRDDGGEAAVTGTAASAAERICRSKSRRISICSNDNNGLFTPQGLTAPAYYVYELLAAYGGSDLKVHSQWAIAGGNGGLAIFLFNINPHTILNACISTQKLSEKFYLIKTEIAEEDNCFATFAQLGEPDIIHPLLRRSIENAAMGRTTFSIIERDKQPELNVIVYQNSLTIIEIITI